MRREIKLVFYGYEKGKLIKYYECVINENHKEFKSELERKLLKYVEKIESRM